MLNEKEGIIEFKFRAWTGTNLFEGPRTRIIDISVGRNKRLIFERTLDWFCFIHVDYSKNSSLKLDFNTFLADARMNPDEREYLMGHKLPDQTLA